MTPEEIVFLIEQGFEKEHLTEIVEALEKAPHHWPAFRHAHGLPPLKPQVRDFSGN
jgi:hypothetical protein